MLYTFITIYKSVKARAVPETGFAKPFSWSQIMLNMQAVTLCYFMQCFCLLRFFGPRYMTQIFIYKYVVHIAAIRKSIVQFLYLLKYDSLFLVDSLQDIVAIDKLAPKNRFTVLYNLLSLSYNYRCFIFLKTERLQKLLSVSQVHASANWSEREVWDLFGIYFLGHNDLRRILTDYGFSGHPLRKDFPLSGFEELNYDDLKATIVYRSVYLLQEFRVFKFLNPWNTNLQQ